MVRDAEKFDSLNPFSSQRTNGIFCNFTLIESDSNEINETTETRVVTPLMKNKAEKFECEQYDELDFVFVNASQIESIGNRFGPLDYEESCTTSKRFVTPKFLNNIYNTLTPILNGLQIVQRVQIVECRSVEKVLLNIDMT